MNNREIKVISKTGLTEFEVLQVKQEEYTEYNILATEPITLEETLIIQWSLPSANIMSQWYPTVGMDRSLKADWDSPIQVANNCSGPVYSLIDSNDQNIQTIALSEFIHPMRIYGGIREEDGQFTLKIEIDIPQGQEAYQVKLYINEMYQKYYDVLTMTVSWWKNSCHQKIFPVSSRAKEAMYSTWYAYHQIISDKSLLAEAYEAKKLGLNTLIIDDGWQTNDSNRGYAYTGDWQVSSDKFSDFKAYVAANHQIGVAIMVWYSVPFIGKKSEHWDELSNKLLTFDDSRQAGILDIRYKTNCDYLVDTYMKAVVDWDIDGLKLDFIDEFYLRQETKPHQESMDFHTVQLGLEYLLQTLKERVLAIKADFLIEFRQRYIGPGMSQYSNMLRVDDCPKSALTNRVGLVDLRLISGETSCHSDMLMWHPDEMSENVAIQLLSCVYGVLQLSVRLAELSKEHKKVLKNYLAFTSNYSTLLLDSTLQADEPENLYPLVKVENQKTSIVTLYARDKSIVLNESIEKTIILNATHSKQLVLVTSSVQRYTYVVSDCFGDVRETGNIEVSGAVMLAQFPGGKVELNQLV